MWHASTAERHCTLVSCHRPYGFFIIFFTILCVGTRPTCDQIPIALGSSVQSHARTPSGSAANAQRSEAQDTIAPGTHQLRESKSRFIDFIQFYIVITFCSFSIQLAKDISSTKLWRKIYAINGKRPDSEDLADIKFRKVNFPPFFLDLHCFYTKNYSPIQFPNIEPDFITAVIIYFKFQISFVQNFTFYVKVVHVT